jgi:hypothetical protein
MAQPGVQATNGRGLCDLGAPASQMRMTFDESVGEMKHADKLIKRFLFLDGLPNLQDLHKLKIAKVSARAWRRTWRSRRAAG